MVAVLFARLTQTWVGGYAPGHEDLCCGATLIPLRQADGGVSRWPLERPSAVWLGRHSSPPLSPTRRCVRFAPSKSGLGCLLPRRQLGSAFRPWWTIWGPTPTGQCCRWMSPTPSTLFTGRRFWRVRLPGLRRCLTSCGTPMEVTYPCSWAPPRSSPRQGPTRAVLWGRSGSRWVSMTSWKRSRATLASSRGRGTWTTGV